MFVLFFYWSKKEKKEVTLWLLSRKCSSSCSASGSGEREERSRIGGKLLPRPPPGQQSSQIKKCHKKQSHIEKFPQKMSQKVLEASCFLVLLLRKSLVASKSGQKGSSQNIAAALSWSDQKVALQFQKESGVKLRGWIGCWGVR